MRRRSLAVPAEAEAGATRNVATPVMWAVIFPHHRSTSGMMINAATTGRGRGITRGRITVSHSTRAAPRAVSVPRAVLSSACSNVRPSRIAMIRTAASLANLIVPCESIRNRARLDRVREAGGGAERKVCSLGSRELVYRLGEQPPSNARLSVAHRSLGLALRLRAAGPSGPFIEPGGGKH